MIRRHSWLVLVAVLVFGAVPLRASSSPAVNGHFAGIEFCEQAVCGAAQFAGFYVGQFGFNPIAIGTITVAVTHNPLPGPGDSADITGGNWLLKLLNGKTLGGGISTVGSALHNNGNGTFEVTVNMTVTLNGSGTLTFHGTLSHNTFPPTISGTITP